MGIRKVARSELEGFVPTVPDWAAHAGRPQARARPRSFLRGRREARAAADRVRRLRGGSLQVVGAEGGAAEQVSVGGGGGTPPRPPPSLPRLPCPAAPSRAQPSRALAH